MRLNTHNYGLILESIKILVYGKVIILKIGGTLKLS